MQSLDDIAAEAIRSSAVVVRAEALRRFPRLSDQMGQQVLTVARGQGHPWPVEPAVPLHAGPLMRANDALGEFLDVGDALVMHAAATVASGLMQRQPTIEKHR